MLALLALALLVSNAEAVLVGGAARRARAVRMPAPRMIALSSAEGGAEFSSRHFRLSRGRADGAIGLQTSVTRFTAASPDGGAPTSVTLFSMTHVAEQRYFDATAAALEDYDCVLYELIVPEQYRSPDPATGRVVLTPAAKELLAVPAADAQFAEQCGLKNQLTSLELPRGKSWIADMSSEQMQAARQARAREQDDSEAGAAQAVAAQRPAWMQNVVDAISSIYRPRYERPRSPLPAGPRLQSAHSTRSPRSSLLASPTPCYKLAPMYVHCAHDFINKLIKRAYVHVCKIVPTLVYDNHPPPPH